MLVFNCVTWDTKQWCPWKMYLRRQKWRHFGWLLNFRGNSRLMLISFDFQCIESPSQDPKESPQIPISKLQSWKLTVFLSKKHNHWCKKNRAHPRSNIKTWFVNHHLVTKSKVCFFFNDAVKHLVGNISNNWYTKSSSFDNFGWLVNLPPHNVPPL